MEEYVFITFAPIQGFIEKSRKLRDLYGASLILSYLSSKLIKAAQAQGTEVISPGFPQNTKGMPNRILLRGSFSEEAAHKALIEAWGLVLEQCRTWLERNVNEFYCSQESKQFSFTWESAWGKWKNYTWELFWGQGKTPEEARKNLENRKLSRQWTAINWIGESSSISGSDGIAYPGLEGGRIDLRNCFPTSVTQEIERFYEILATMFDLHKSQWASEIENHEAEGRFIDANERLSVPELVKRLVTHSSVARLIGITPPHRFRDIIRKTDTQLYWTGWFMGDGDHMGNHLQRAMQQSGETAIQDFSQIIRNWGLTLEDNLPPDVGRIVYAGGDDFLGIIYDRTVRQTRGIDALSQLTRIHQSWMDLKPQLDPLVGESVTLSVGLVWVGGAVPQRDVLQHCRETQQRSKQLGRDRITIRILFNNGQFVEWTTPWEYLKMLEDYKDLDGGKNWSHVYGDLAQLKARHAFGFGRDDLEELDDTPITDFFEGALEFLDIYFPTYKTIIESNRSEIFRYAMPDETKVQKELIRWIDSLINVGWHLSETTSNSLLVPTETIDV
ncbi:type III-B CRISPR-associated protein Cas10/Cmr2 [Kamptonema animale CS-326]|jgi:CRISPR-associated protein Cmr2|uniref:Cas10/Cmr2 second palm domain-containing protein n=1 Tax=Kamptonema animale TaxID=92934 RepID=UPI00232E3D21|nr:type III-B CRISPR-associated protein Cas10/Cmr2 [Kamptonema animale]MDB9512835.1 type III-B CRISPR-associated protein Cas10/Cmr2 [Kamptonema animale CS-326]